MAYQVFALKYRPRTFREVAGQDHVTTTLTNALAKSRVAHAFLFAGPRGVGKTSVARILARALNCEKGPSKEPCNACKPCQGIVAGSFMDVLEIDGASHALVDDIRGIVENVRYLPSQGRYKIYIIDEVHMLGQSAFNALLKTLEEPPSHAVFILATTDPNKIPSTVISRCQRYDFGRLPLRIIVERLKAVSAGEGIEASEGALYIIAREAFGSMRDALVLLDQVQSFTGKKIAESDVVEMLGVPERQIIYDLSSAIISRDAGRCLDILERVYSSGHDLKRLGEDLIEHFRNLLVYKITGEAGRLIDLPQGELGVLDEQANAVSAEDLHLFFNTLADYIGSLARATSPRIHMEMALARIASLPEVTSIGELIRKMEAMEGRLSDPSSTPEPQSSRAQRSNSPVEVPASPPVTSNADSGKGDRGWKGFLEFLRKKNPPLASYLDHGALVEERGAKIIIGFPRKSVFCEHLQERERASALNKVAEEFYGKPIKMEFIESQEPAKGPKKESGGTPDQPLVKEVIRVFGGGEIVEIKKL